MEPYKLKENDLFFEKVLQFTANGSIYLWIDAQEIYTIKDGCFYGTRRGVRKMKEITSRKMWNKIKIK